MQPVLCALLLFSSVVAHQAETVVAPIASVARLVPSGDSTGTIDWLADMTPIEKGRKTLAAAREHWLAGRYKKAAQAYRKALSGKLPAELKPRVRFLLGRVLLDARQYEKAARAFAALGDKEPLLADWTRYHEGQSWYALREWSKAAQALGRVDGKFVRARQAWELRCIAHFYADEFDAFAQCAAGYARTHRLTGTLLTLQARHAYEANRKEEAVRLVREIHSRMPHSGAFRDVRDLARKLRREGFDKKLELSVDEQLTRIDASYRAHRYTAASKAADALVDSLKKGTGEWCRAKGQAALSRARNREQSKSMPFFEAYVEHCAGHYDPATLYQGVKAAYQAGKLTQAEAWAPLLAGTFPESTLCEDGLLFLARLYERKDNDAGVRRTVDAIFRDFATGDMAPDAAWLLVFSLYRADKLQAAYDLADKYRQALPPRNDYRTDGRLLYWMGRIEERQKKDKAARRHYTEVLERFPLSWYGLLAYLRLEDGRKGRGSKTLDRLRKASKATLPTVKAVLAEADTWGLELSRALLLLSLDLKDEARDELEPILEADQSSAPRLLLAAWLYDRAGHYTKSHNLLRRTLSDFRYAYPQEEDDRWWKVAYPYPFRGLVEKSAKTESVPWNLVVGIIREESGFAPDVESYAHAFGLMQLLQKTASWVAGKPVSTGQLRIPEENIPLGTRYVRYLLDKFDHPVLAVAGYNSGPGGVYKTLKRTRNREIDEFVEHIPYNQTRRYTKRVISSAWTYQVLYEDKGAIPFALRFKKIK